MMMAIVLIVIVKFRFRCSRCSGRQPVVLALSLKIADRARRINSTNWLGSGASDHRRGDAPPREWCSTATVCIWQTPIFSG